MVDSLKKPQIWNWILGMLVSGLVLASAICLLIDFLLNGALSWSLIVSFSCFLVGMSAWVAYKVRQDKIVKVALVLSVLLFPYLWLIHSLYDYGISLPRTLGTLAIWLIFAWIIIGLLRLTRLSLFDVIGISCIVSIVNVFATHFLDGQGLFDFAWSDMLSIFGNLVIGLVFLILARLEIISKMNRRLNDFRYK